MLLIIEVSGHPTLILAPLPHTHTQMLNILQHHAFINSFTYFYHYLFVLDNAAVFFMSLMPATLQKTLGQSWFTSCHTARISIHWKSFSVDWKGKSKKMIQCSMQQTSQKHLLVNHSTMLHLKTARATLSMQDIWKNAALEQNGNNSIQRTLLFC